MSEIEIDASEIIKAADDLKNVAPKQMLNAVRRITTAAIKDVHTAAKAAAPRDRPWLATQGIRRVTRQYGDAVVGTVYGISDPRGRPVGFFVLYGTSTTPPVDFLTPAIAPHAQTYPAAVLAAIEPLSGSIGGGGGGDLGGDGDA